MSVQEVIQSVRPTKEAIKGAINELHNSISGLGGASASYGQLVGAMQPNADVVTSNNAFAISNFEEADGLSDCHLMRQVVRYLQFPQAQTEIIGLFSQEYGALPTLPTTWD